MGEKPWVIDLTQKLSELSDIKKAQSKEWEMRSIYKLPPCIIDRNEKAYKPQLVSFGPYHHGDPNLKPMEYHKERALLHFLNRSGKPLECYVKTLGEFIQDLKGAYDSRWLELEPKWQRNNSDEFLKLMVRDGCFMLEILQIFTGTEAGYTDMDPIFGYHGRLFWEPYIMSDMLMLENQLPMLLLEKLHAVGNPDFAETDRTEYINELVQKFYFHHKSTKQLGKCMHIIDVYRKRLLFQDQEAAQEGRNISLPETELEEAAQEGHNIFLQETELEAAAQEERRNMQENESEEAAQEEERNSFSARELQEAGVRIRRSSTSSLKDIHFDCNRGILSLPRIIVDDFTATHFLNLIAFEGHHFGAGNEVTDYIYFMDGIIDNAKDVEVLKSHDIIDSFLGSNEAVADLFNSISKDVTTDDSGNLGEVWRMTNKYCKTRYHRWRASLVETYFRNPWAIISVVAAFFLFALTIIQTVYTAGQFYQK